MASSKSFEVIIFGGGPAGAAAAITLARCGIRTAIIEHSDYSTLRVGETLPPVIYNILTQLGVWQHFLEAGPIESISIRSAWGSAKAFDSDHIYNPYGSGWHIDRACFDRMLIKAASNVGAILFTETHISNLSHDHLSGWEVTIQRDKCSDYLMAPFIIDATGQRSAIPIGLFRSFRVVDRLIGILRYSTRLAKPYTLIEAEADGWWYSAPLPGDRLVVVHMTDADLLAGSDFNTSDYWNHKLVQAPLTFARTGQQHFLTQPKILSAASLIRSPVCGTDWLAAGDACVAFDPLSGRGIYSALKGGILAAEAAIAKFQGDNNAFTEYSARINSQFSNYLHMRSAIYNKEQRWCHTTFWRRRQSIVTA
jgi:flavin-dependent dehydrogenase